MFTDTHCHIHESGYPLDKDEVIAAAMQAGVTKLISVGTSNRTSEEAVSFAESHHNVWASIGVHPHDATEGIQIVRELSVANSTSLVAIGEIGLDYHYLYSPRDTQIKAFEAQMQIALERGLPVIFHVREAFDDFWPIVANFPGIRGVIHSYTDSLRNLEKGIQEGFYIGVNGISVFSKNNHEVWDAIPLERMVLETDAPFLTPPPHRGKVNQPAFVRHVAEYHALRRGVELEHLARVTSANASTLFSI